MTTRHRHMLAWFSAGFFVLTAVQFAVKGMPLTATSMLFGALFVVVLQKAAERLESGGSDV